MPALRVLVSVLGAAFLLLPAYAAADEGKAVPDRSAILASVPEDLREGVRKSLEQAQDNAREIEGGIERLTDPAEKRWACWLVAHMQDKVHARYGAGGESVAESDLRVVTADLLVDNVRLAAQARTRYPWAAAVPEDLFCDYVLAYRFTEEPIENWRPQLWREVEPIVADCKTAEEAALALNRWAAQKVKYVPREAEDLGILSLEKAGQGRCEDMSNFVRAALATIGIPAASVYTPWWPKADGNHAWNEVWLDGAWRQFMGCEPAGEPPFFDRIKQSSVFAKVYRSGFLRSRSAPEDVSASYTPVRAVLLRTGAGNRGIELQVLNMGAWRGVAGARADAAGTVHFPDVGCRADLLLRAAAPDGSWSGTPFILRTLAPGTTAPESEPGEFLDTTPLRGARDAYPRIVLDAQRPDTPILLFCWNGNWDAIGLALSDDHGRVDFGPLGRPRTIFAVARKEGNQAAEMSRPFVFESDAKGELQLTRY